MRQLNSREILFLFISLFFMSTKFFLKKTYFDRNFTFKITNHVAIGSSAQFWNYFHKSKIWKFNRKLQIKKYIDYVDDWIQEFLLINLSKYLLINSFSKSGFKATLCYIVHVFLDAFHRIHCLNSYFWYKQINI